MSHLTELDMLNYISEDCNESQQILVEEHVSSCDSCLNKLRAHLYVKSHASSLMESWSAEEHGKAFRQLAIAQALRRAAEKDKTLTQRTVKWLMSAGANIGESARLLIDQAKNIGLSAAQSFTPGMNVSLRPVLQGIASPEIEEACQRIESGSKLLADGRGEEATQFVAQAIKVDARVGQSSILEWRQADGILKHRLVIDSKKRKASLMRLSSSPRDIGSLAVLLPEDDMTNIIISKFEKLECADYLLAEFSYLPDGQYSLLIEPVFDNPHYS